MMIALLLFLQKQNLATAIYLFGLGTLLRLRKPGIFSFVSAHCDNGDPLYGIIYCR
jgi:hypothetical protein